MASCTKRKLSDLTSEETNDIVSLLKNLLGELDEEDEDGQSVVDSVKNVIRKLEKTEVCSCTTCYFDTKTRKSISLSLMFLWSLWPMHT